MALRHIVMEVLHEGLLCPRGPCPMVALRPSSHNPVDLDDIGPRGSCLEVALRLIADRVRAPHDAPVAPASRWQGQEDARNRHPEGSSQRLL